VDSAQTYRQIGVRSHGKGIFHKEAVTGTELGDKRVFHVVPNALVVNIVFAWEQAVALTSDAEAGFVASHRFPMFTEKGGKSYLPFLRKMFLTKRGKLLLEMASPGGAGRNKTLGQQEFLKLKPVVPSRAEQKKIADAIGVVDAKLTALAAKQAALGRFKAGLMQKLFRQRLRFTREDGGAFPDWQEKRLGELLVVTMGQSPDSGAYNNEGRGLPLIQGNADISNRTSAPRRFTSEVTKVCEIGDILISVRAPIGEISLSAHRACLGRGIASLKAREHQYQRFWLQFLLYYEPQWQRVGQGSTFSAISGPDIRGIKVLTPHPDEQAKIANALLAMDAKIQAVADQATKLQTFKKGLLQQMFV